MTKCNHEYKYTQGYFFCVKCKDRIYPQSRYQDFPTGQEEHTSDSITRRTFYEDDKDYESDYSPASHFTVKYKYSGGRPSKHKRKISHSEHSTKKKVAVPFIIMFIMFGVYALSYPGGVDVTTHPSLLKNNGASTGNTNNGDLEQGLSTNNSENNNANIKHLERDYVLKIYHYTNVAREQNHLPSLALSNTINVVARLHSYDMQQNDFFAHDNLQGESPTDRGNRIGVTCVIDYGSYIRSGLAENIHMMSGYDTSNSRENSKIIVDRWMDSPGHRENILSSEYTKIGIGVRVHGDSVHSTQNFC